MEKDRPQSQRFSNRWQPTSFITLRIASASFVARTSVQLSLHQPSLTLWVALAACALIVWSRSRTRTRNTSMRSTSRIAASRNTPNRPGTSHTSLRETGPIVEKSSALLVPRSKRRTSLLAENTKVAIVMASELHLHLCLQIKDEIVVLTLW